MMKKQSNAKLAIKNIESFGNMTASALAKYTEKKYSKSLCSECAQKIAEQDKPTDGIEEVGVDTK